jgi:hypothetical protein
MLTREVYDLTFGCPKGAIVILLGEAAAKGWLTKWGGDLAQAVWISLIPKEGEDVPPLKVNIPQGMQFVYYRRVAGAFNCPNPGPRKVTYVLGWHDGSIETVIEQSLTAEGPQGLRMVQRARSV